MSEQGGKASSRGGGETVSEAERRSKQEEAERRSKQEETEALREAADAGIHRLAIPTPFRIGDVNAYLIEDEPLTLVDSGPDSGTALDELERGLKSLGHRIEDLGLLVVTHQHLDHFGLFEILARRSGAEVAAFGPAAQYLRDYKREAERDDEFAQHIMLRHGVPADVVAAVRAVAATVSGWGANVEVSAPLRDGERFTLRDRSIEALHRPGHSPSDTVFLDVRSRCMLVGDHLIKRISSNPRISRPLDARPGEEEALAQARPKALVAYIESLKATKEMDAAVVLPGHGPPIVDHSSLIDERFRMHERRARKIMDLIAERPRSAHEIAIEIWGNAAVTQALLTISEVLGHVDFLLDEGKVLEEDEGGVTKFEAAAS